MSASPDGHTLYYSFSGAIWAQPVAGGVPKRDRVGHAFIKKTMAETKAVFGGELSGHIYFRDYYYADSAAVAFARVLSILSASNEPSQTSMMSCESTMNVTVIGRVAAST